MPYLTQKVAFSASHFYWNPRFSDDENQRIFGACANTQGHGHNYQVEVCLQGKIDPKTGMVINFFDLEPILAQVILKPLDHQNLNTQVPYFQNKIPTLENIACYIWEHLSPPIRQAGIKLHRIKVIENPSLYVEYDGKADLPC